MHKNITRTLAAAALLFATSCAGSYSTIRPDRIASYTSSSAPSAPVEFSYQYDALHTNGANKKYNKKARKRGYQAVAVRIKNNTGSDLNFSRDLELYFGDRPVMPIPALQAANDLKQGVAIYLLYVLLNVNVGGTSTYNPATGVTTTSGGTFLPTGPFIAGGNMLGASQANKNMRTEFVTYDLTNKIIRPGETVYGIVSLRELNVAPLHLILRNAASLQAAPAALPGGGQH